jgi:hypothetical protein
MTDTRDGTPDEAVSLIDKAGEQAPRMLEQILAAAQPGAVFGQSVEAGGSVGRPVANIVTGPSGVTVRPVVDITKVALAALTASAAMFGMRRAIRRARRAKRKGTDGIGTQGSEDQP